MIRAVMYDWETDSAEILETVVGIENEIIHQDKLRRRVWIVHLLDGTTKTYDQSDYDLLHITFYKES